MNLTKKISHYHFEVYHFIVLIIFVVFSQVMLSYLNMASTNDLLEKIMVFYKLETAERQTDFTTSSIELFLQKDIFYSVKKTDSTHIIEAIDYLIYQQLLQKNVEDFCMIFYQDSEIIILDDGLSIFNYVFTNNHSFKKDNTKRENVIKYFEESSNDIFNKENITSHVENGKTFHVFVPFSKKGEVIGAIYQRITPDVENLSSTIRSSFNYTGAWISAIILFGLLIVFILTNYVVNERDTAQKALFKQKEKQLTQLIEARKEASFARRIYHAHHKAEKIIGFIQNDLLKIKGNNFKEITQKIKKYTNFIGRVIYDMKTYNPPVNVIRNQQFNTNLNELIKFVVKDVIQRTYRDNESVKFQFNFSEKFPIIKINEYVVWEIIEPLIQNSIVHNKDAEINIVISTITGKTNKIEISDNGKGFDRFLLQPNKNNVKKIFQEKTSTKNESINTGYGCYIAYENCKKCGWKIDAINLKTGAKFIIIVN